MLALRGPYGAKNAFRVGRYLTPQDALSGPLRAKSRFGQSRYGVGGELGIRFSGPAFGAITPRVRQF